MDVGSLDKFPSASEPLRVVRSDLAQDQSALDDGREQEAVISALLDLLLTSPLTSCMACLGAIFPASSPLL